MADQGSEGLLSPFLRTQRLRAVRPWLKGRVLDVGCGSGELAAELPPDRYYGFDKDPEAVALAQSRFPRHRFTVAWPDLTEHFETVVALAVIEHVAQPDAFLASLARFLSSGTDARLLLTTPHPCAEGIHTLGAAVGLFSRHASEEHEKLLDLDALHTMAGLAGLRLLEYRRFLLKANQLAVLAPFDALSSP